MAELKVPSYTGLQSHYASRRNITMKTTLPATLRSIPLTVCLVALTSTMTGCGPEQDEQIVPSIQSQAFAAGQPLPHIHTAGFGTGYYVATVPADLQPSQHPFRTPRIHHHATLPQPGN